MLHGDILAERAKLSPERTALVYIPTGERISYAEMNRRAEACARYFLQSLGLEKGDRVAILANNRPEYLDIFFGVIKAGIIIVPLNTKLTAREVEHIVTDAGVRALIYASSTKEVVRTLRSHLQLDHWIAFDDPIHPEDHQHHVLQAGVDSKEEIAPCHPEDLCALLYTSGTTGKPKGVMIPQRMVSWNALNTALCWQLRDTDISPIFTPLYHAGGLSAFITPIFAVGGTIVLHEGFDAGEALSIIERHKCTVVFGVPTMFRFFLDHKSFPNADFSSVRWFISGGAPLSPQLVHAYRDKGSVLRQGYGLTEVGVNCFSMTSEEALSHPGAVGRPMMFTQARLTCPEGKDVPNGDVGELLLRGPHVSKGYWNHPETTADSYDEDGYFHTGDLAVQSPEGIVTIVGRLTDMFISGGVNIYPPEIEAELLLNEDVVDAVVLGVPDPVWGETGVAFVLPKQGKRPSKESLTNYLQSRIARFKIPKAFVLVASLPRTPYGKVRKSELREAYLEGFMENLIPRTGKEASLGAAC